MYIMCLFKRKKNNVLAEYDPYALTNVITIAGDQLGGATPANDCVVTVQSVTGSGGLQGVSPSGLAVNTATFTSQSGSNLIGSGFIADISMTGGSYSIDFDSPGDGGSNYGANQTFVIPGTQLSGQSPANDLTITITGVVSDDSTARGEVTSVSLSGTASQGAGTFNNASTNNVNQSGTNAKFNVTRSSQDSTGIYESISFTNGTGYVTGDKVVV